MRIDTGFGIGSFALGLFSLAAPNLPPKMKHILLVGSVCLFVVAGYFFFWPENAAQPIQTAAVNAPDSIGNQTANTINNYLPAMQTQPSSNSLPTPSQPTTTDNSPSGSVASSEQACGGVYANGVTMDHVGIGFNVPSCTNLDL